MKFEEKLFGLRKQAGMTQSDLAEKLNVSRQAVSRWEMGTAKPEVDTLIAMCDLFNVSLDYLLRDKAAEEEREPEQQLPPVPQYWDFVPRFWWIPAGSAVLLKVLPYILSMLQLTVPAVGFGITRWLNDHPVAWLFTLPFSNLTAIFFGAAAVLCFIWALYKFLKARK